MIELVDEVVEKGPDDMSAGVDDSDSCMAVTDEASVGATMFAGGESCGLAARSPARVPARYCGGDDRSAAGALAGG